MSDYDVVIAGGGVGGGACALALATQYPLRVLVLEQHEGAGNLNRGDNLLPTVTRHLLDWGVVDRLRTAGARDLARMQVFGPQGKLLDVPLRAPDDPPYLVLSHPEIEKTLINAALDTGNVDVHYRSRLTGLMRDGDRVCGALVANGGREEQITARLVIGADGVNSETRKALGIELPKIPYDHGYFGIALERPDSYEDAMRVELSPQGGVLVVPRLEPGLVGLGVLVRTDQETLFRSGTLDEKVDAIRQRSHLFAGCRAFAKGAHLYRLGRGHAQKYIGSGAALIGDAVHLTNPVAGQGMTMAIEDAAAIADHVGPVLSGGDAIQNLGHALAKYEAERKPKNASTLRWSHCLSHAYAYPGRHADWIRRHAFSMAETKVGRKVHAAIYGRLARRLA